MPEYKKSSFDTDLQLEFMDQLMLFLKNTDISQITIKKKDQCVSLKRSQIQRDTNLNSEAVFTTGENTQTKQTTKDILSPTVGIFYHVIENISHIKKNEKIGFIKKIDFQIPIISPWSGIIIQWHVQNEDAVEYGQKLFAIKL